MNKENKKIADRIRESGFVRRLKDDQQLKMILLVGAVAIAVMIVYAIADRIRQMILL